MAEFTDEDDALLEELGVEVEAKASGRPDAARGTHHRRLRGDPAIRRRTRRAPQHGEDRDIFERLYAVRLDRLRELEECRTPP